MTYVPSYIIVLFFLITTDYFLAQEIDKRTGNQRKMMLFISVCINIGTLFVFKYFNFFNESVGALASLLHWNYSPTLLAIALPIGLSFHVFQSLSYVIEVYRKNSEPERNYCTYALYVLFFPQLVAGPIERPQHLLPQLHSTHSFDPVLARRGLERMLWGFFKKLVIADQLAQIINPLYRETPENSWLLALIAVMFLYQLYCDFSGYVDIALGAAMMLGFRLTENFNRPFAARSVTDFWRRWHISLSSWLRDYLYYPLAFSWGKISKIRLYISLFITFVLIGLWHGASFTFMIFGALHGVYLIVESVTEKLRKKIVVMLHLHKVQMIHHLVQTLTVFALVTVSFIFFRVPNVSDAFSFIYHIVRGSQFSFSLISQSLTAAVGPVIVCSTFVSIVLMEVVQYVQARKETLYIFDDLSKVSRYSWYYFLSCMIFFFGYFGAQSFIYFQF